MSTGLTVATMVRDEADRYLPSALEQWSRFADTIVLLDDNSNDNGATQDLAERYEKVRYSVRRSSTAAWGAEAQARSELWSHALSADTDWILVLDADMVPARSPRSLLRPQFDAVAFGLYDLWREDDGGRLWYRTDGPWRAHTVYRTWAVRARERPPGGWLWPDRGLHCGHFPQNLRVERPLYAPPDHGLLHAAYLRPVDRRRKHSQYLAEAGQLTDEERAHAESIIDEAPRLEPLPFKPEYHLVHEADR